MNKKLFFNLEDKFSSKKWLKIKFKINDEIYFYYFDLIEDYKSRTSNDDELNLLDEQNLNNIMDASSTISSLAIEGIHTSKKAQNSIDNRVSDLENTLAKKEITNKFANASMIKSYQNFIDQEYKKYLNLSNDKKIISKSIFAQNLGLNLANYFIHTIWKDSSASLNHLILQEVYSRLTCGGINLGITERERLNNIPDGRYYRNDVVKIYSGFNIVDEGVPPEKVENYMQNLFEFIILPSNFYLNSSEDYKYKTFEIVSIIHFLFIRIHPYYDGNGRMARLITNSLLARMANIPEAMFNFGIKITRSIYYECIKKARIDNNLTYFIKYYFYLAKVIQEIVAFNQEYMLSIGTSFTEKEIESLMIMILFQEKPFISWKEIQSLLSDKDFASESTIKNILSKLSNCGYLVKIKINKNIHYHLAKKYIWKN